MTKEVYSYSVRFIISMSFNMTLIMTSKLYTDEDLDFERVFEIRVIDLRKRKGVKQKSFSVLVKKGTKDDEYSSAEDVKKELQKAIRGKV